MSYSDDENLPGECDWCHDDRGLCDGLTWTKIGASALSSRRPSMLKRYATTTSVFFVI